MDEELKMNEAFSQVNKAIENYLDCAIVLMKKNAERGALGIRHAHRLRNVATTYEFYRTTPRLVEIEQDLKAAIDSYLKSDEFFSSENKLDDFEEWIADRVEHELSCIVPDCCIELLWYENDSILNDFWDEAKDSKSDTRDCEEILIKRAAIYFYLLDYGKEYWRDSR